MASQPTTFFVDVLGDGAKARGVHNPDAVPIRFNQTALLEILQDDIHRLAGEAYEVSEVGLIEPEWNEDALLVGNPVIGGQVQQQRLCDARGRALAEQFFNPGSVRRLRTSGHLVQFVPSDLSLSARKTQPVPIQLPAGVTNEFQI